MFVAISLLFLTSCSLFKPNVVIRDRIIYPEPLELSDPEPLELLPVYFHIINKENYEEVFSKLEELGYNPVLWGLTDEGYENLSLNQKEIISLIEELRKMIQEQRNYYERKSSESDNSRE